MSKDKDQRDELLDDEDDDLLDDDLDQTDDTEYDEEDESDEESSEDDKEKKRLRDLQSAKDKETARANKAEAALKKMTESLKPGAGKPEGSVPPEVQKWLDAAKEGTRTRLYESDPRFKEYGLPRSLIAGDTPEDMEASATQLKRLVAKVESRVRESVLKEHGFAEAPSGSTKLPKRDYGNMSTEDFEKVLRQALSG